MKLAGMPDTEQEPPHARRDAQLLGRENEVALDNLTRLAAHLLDVPMALLSLVDGERQWFTARDGRAVTPLSRDNSFCGHVVATTNALLVRDAHADARFADDPLVTGEPNVRFYAGMPLRTSDGHILGSLCAIDHVPRDPTPAQLEMLGLLASQVMLLLEKRRLRLQLAAENSVNRAHADKLTSIFAVMAEGVVVQESGGAIVACNDAASRILGLTHDQLCGRTSIDPAWHCLREDGAPFPGEEHPAMVALRTGERQESVVMGVHRPDGTLRWISINSLPSRREGDRVTEVVTTFHDTTPLRLAAERIAHQERLATTGTLVAGVGHEINNPLAFMMGNLDFAIEELRAITGTSPSARLHEVREMLDEVRIGADRICKIVRGLRALSREDVALQPVELQPVVETSVSMALHELRRKARVTIDVASLPPVLGDESRLTQVLVNLLVNAAHAFTEADPEVNRVTVTGRVTSRSRLRLSVIDNGPGVTPSLRARIFDPFFTTKVVGKGTGLGLAVSRGIISALGGDLSLESPADGGAAFHIDLEIAMPEAGHAPDAVVQPVSPRGRVLLLDDEHSVLASMKRLLSREHQVTVLSDSRHAATLLTSGAGDFDVVFCDLMMPHLTGEQLHTMVQEHHPDLASRFVFVTGGATNTSVTSFLSQLPNEVLEKPFSMTDLLAIARRYVLRRAARQSPARVTAPA